MNAAPRPVETVYEDAELTLRLLPGTAHRLVVVFTGRKAGFGGQPPDEFAGSASHGGENSVLFVTDRQASWYAAPGLWRKIVRMVREVRASVGALEVMTLGNSMGGYGALLLPRDLRVARAIAFSPQVTLDRGLLDDARWPEIADEMPERCVADTFAGTRTQYYLTAGAGCAEDVAHLALVPEGKRVHRWVLPRGRHNVAGALKEAGLLARVIDAILRGRRTRVDALYARYGRRLA
ncbi:hypothetical protein MWU52_13365 [Jannaschia sp. S6380]|uniref:hypothetical protein n=1 Tax=Jannaschia sp. S6380 TaxID=2926408 RepID=UPI001FF1515A|nr:hypothetical protein [Jannaschia sp. S6380]MCK0168548.1 hypothetical protein [Jannaschia sp. S6380]